MIGISIIIIAPKLASCVEVLKSMQKVTDHYFEIIVSLGADPSTQRNQAAKHAKYDCLYFVDADTIFIPECLTVIRKHMQKGFDIVGGNSPTPATDSIIEQSIGKILESRIGSLWIRNRFISYGKYRKGTENNLILCNLCVKKDIFEYSNGFLPGLYPGEENEWLKRIKLKRYKTIHDPELKIWHHRPRTILKFMKKCFIQGVNRTLVEKMYATQWKLLVIYSRFLLLAMVFIFTAISQPRLIIIGLFVYLFCILLNCIIILLKTKNIKVFLSSTILHLVLHAGYATGLFAGLFYSTKISSKNIICQIVKYFPGFSHLHDYNVCKTVEKKIS